MCFISYKYGILWHPMASYGSFDCQVWRVLLLVVVEAGSPGCREIAVLRLEILDLDLDGICWSEVLG